MSTHSADLAAILVREFFGPATATVVEVLFKYGRMTLVEIGRQSGLPRTTLSEALTVLIQHQLARWAAVDEGTAAERVYYECFFDDIYPLIRYGQEIQLAEKHTGLPEAGSLLQYLMMQGRQRIKDIISTLTDSSDIDHKLRTKTLNNTLTTLLNEKYLRVVQWWHLTPPDDLQSKIAQEEEKKLRGEKTTSAGLSTKTIKEAASKTLTRINALKEGDKKMEGLKRRPDEKIDIAAHREAKRRRRGYALDDEEEEEVTTLDVNDNASLAVDHKKFPLLVRNQELVWEVHKRLGPATASIYEIVLTKVEDKIKTTNTSEEPSEITVSTTEVAILLPDPTKSNSFTDLVEPPSQPSRQLLSNGTGKLKRLGRRGGYSSDEDDMGEVKINGIFRNDEDILQYKIQVVSEHLQSLAEDSELFIRPSSGSSAKPKDDEEWIVNLRTLTQFLRQNELESIVERKYGGDALRLVRIIAEKHHVDQDQFEKLILLKNKELRSVLSTLQTGGILEVQEIPKSSGFERAKNYNLWSFHESRARSFVLQDLYKTLVRIYQRIDEERTRKQGILKKAQRTDVKKDLRRYLSPDELRQYGEWRALEERLLGQIMRVDRSVMLLRDV